MPTIVDQLLSMGNNLLSKGTGVKESLAALMKQPFSRKLISLRFDSLDGTLASLGVRTDDSPYAISKQSLHPVLSENRGSEKRFLFSMMDSQWEVLSAFTIGPYQWFTMVSLDTSQPASTPLKSGLFKIVDYFTGQCKELIGTFLSDIGAICSSKNSSFMSTSPEQVLIDKLASFSSDIQDILLLHENGTLMFKSGTTIPPEELAHSLVQLFHRANVLHPAAVPNDQFNGITLAHDEYTVEIGKIRDTNCFILITTCGINATATSSLIKRIALDAFFELLKSNGSIGGIPRNTVYTSHRIQKSWFLPPEIIPQGSFATLIGSADFHDPYCRALVTASDEQILWFRNRAEALQQHLRPCPVCTP